MEKHQRDARPAATQSYATLSAKGLLRSIIGSASTYTFGVFGIRTIEFLVLPVYWALLSPLEYGILAIATVVTEFLRAIFGFGLPEAVSRFYYDWPSDERPRRIGAIWTAAWGGSAALALALLALGPALLAPLIAQAEFRPYLGLAIVVALMSSLVQMPLMVLRITERARSYVAGTAVTTLGSTALSIYMVVGLGRGARGVLEAQAITYGVMGLVYAVAMAPRVRPNVDGRLLGGVLAFSLPLIPSKLLEAAATVVDRFLLEKFVSLQALGIYHAARQVGRAVEMLGYSVLTAWIPFQIRVITEREDGRRVVARIAPILLYVILFAAVLIAVLGPPGIRALGLAEYAGVAPLLPASVAPAAILAMAHLLIQGYIIARKTQYAWLRSGSRLVTVVAAMWILLPLWGVYGAFTALALAALVQGIVGYVLSQHFFPIPFRWRGVSLLSGAAVLLVVVAQALDEMSLAAHFAGAAVLLGLYGLAVARALSTAREA